MEVSEAGGWGFLCLGVKAPEGQAKITVDGKATPELKYTIMRGAESEIIKETA